MTDLQQNYTIGSTRVGNSYNKANQKRLRAKCIKPTWVFEIIQPLNILFTIRKHELVDAMV